jgi:hypothetical protein
LTALATGGFVATWQSNGQDGSGLGVYARRYNASGYPVSGEFRVNDYTTADQSNPTIAARPDGGFVTAWASNGQDGSGFGVYQKVFAADASTGSSGSDVMLGTTRNDILTGGAGADTYMLGMQSGADVVNNLGRAADGDKVLLEAGIAGDQLWFRHVGNDLLVDVIGTSNNVAIKDWYLSGANHVASFQTAGGSVLLDTAVENLVNAMAAFAPPALGETALSQNYQDQLAPVLAANWQHN